MSSQRRARWLVPLVLLVVWLGAGAAFGPFAGRLGEVATNDQTAFLPRSAESTRVLREQEAFRQQESLAAIVVWTGRDGGSVAAARPRAAKALASLAGDPALAGRAASPPVVSDDERALQAVVPLRPDLGDRLPAALDRVREAAGQVPGTTVLLAGPAASQADLSDAFAGIDGLLLVVALVTVLVILLLVYRSVLLPLLIILGAVFALGVACAVVYALASDGLVRVDGQVQGILSILVIGAATDYALLLTARHREELEAGRDRFGAVRAAVRRSAGAVVASGATVAAGLLALLLSDLTNNRALGPVGAVGIVCALLSALTFLPVVLVLLGRAAYWPAVPGRRTGAERGRRLWERVADRVDRSPRRVWAAALVALLACAAPAPTLVSKGVPLDEIFVDDAPSVTAQATLARHFPGGSGNPALVTADAGRLPQVRSAARGTPGVASVAPLTGAGRPGGPGEPLVADGRALLYVTLDAGADSDAARATVPRLRSAVHAVPGADALVGGYTAQLYDTQQTARHDRTVIVPVVLAVILVVLAGLLRSLVAPVLLVATVALSFLATLGVSALVFEHLLGFSGTDPSVPLYGFVFLVALGVDYNIFLMSRVREESLRLGVREGVRRGLVTTGGVITSAGVVLAATFAALVVIPLAFLVQIAFIVAFGVLLDTLVVRSLLVPALVRDLGRTAWWPGRLSRAEPEHRRTAAPAPGGAPVNGRPRRGAADAEGGRRAP
ncbi:putative membrane protein [Streptomyces lucensis JCM 4490]|uniref:Membrane protein n=1 Tax=Streptomyces lucensis JCM 4490 TaxID=1306176 RepID=A0A918J3M2_9ACTN|nr:MMPL family transporter [Streptomyces lucensis]GGW44860.1 putative membrane protein [Streptomyces lucensis JCM 4490]